jgi:hypothetical protein
MSQEMNMNEKPTLERKKTPLYQLNADKTTIPRDDQLGGEPTALGQEKWKEPTAFDSSKPITVKPVTIEITEVEYRYPKVGQEKLGEDFAAPIEQPIKPVTESAPLTQEFPEGEQKGVWEGAKDKLRQGVEKTKEAFNSIKPTTTTTTTPVDSEFTENKPGVIERVKGVFTGPKESEYTDQNKPGVLEGAKNMVGKVLKRPKECSLHQLSLPNKRNFTPELAMTGNVLKNRANFAGLQPMTGVVTVQTVVVSWKELREWSVLVWKRRKEYLPAIRMLNLHNLVSSKARRAK